MVTLSYLDHSLSRTQSGATSSPMPSAFRTSAVACARVADFSSSISAADSGPNAVSSSTRCFRSVSSLSRSFSAASFSAVAAISAVSVAGRSASPTERMFSSGSLRRYISMYADAQELYDQ